MKRRSAGLATAVMLSAALLVPAQPVDASEVVKLTRLVLTGKRSVDNTKASTPSSPVERLPKVSIDGLRMDETPTQIAGQLRSGNRPS